jgi:hypothetical protein
MILIENQKKSSIFYDFRRKYIIGLNLHKSDNYWLDKSYTIGYTQNMKTAISIDNQLYEEAEKFSKNAGLSRSKLYSTAINEYIQNHSSDLITEKLNSYYKDHESKLDEDLKYAAYRLLNREDW